MIVTMSMVFDGLSKHAKKGIPIVPIMLSWGPFQHRIMQLVTSGGMYATYARNRSIQR